MFADIEPTTFTIDPAAVEAAITPRTSAIVATHVFGTPCDLDALAAIAGRHGLARRLRRGAQLRHDASTVDPCSRSAT